jgi:hypothetical protein
VEAATVRNDNTGSVCPLHRVRSVKLTSGFVTVECDSSVSGELTHEGKGNITSLTFTNCACSLGNPVTASANASTQSPYTVTTTASGKNDGNGSMTVKGSITGGFVCAGIPCNYTATEAGGANGSLAVTGSGTTEINARVAASSIILTKEMPGSSGFCSGSATWEGSYAVINPATLWST